MADRATTTLRPPGRVHVVGAGPVGLFLTALLQSMEGQAVRIYERRDEYTRTRMVSLAAYLVADSIESYKVDTIDGQSVEAIFDASSSRPASPIGARSPATCGRRLTSGRGIRPAQHHRALAERLDRGARTGTVERIAGEVTAEQAMAMLEPGDILVDCTGARSLMRDLLVPGGDADRAVGTRSGSGSSTPWSSRSCTTSTTRATSSASTTRTPRTPTTSSSRPFIGPTTTDRSAM